MAMHCTRFAQFNTIGDLVKPTGTELLAGGVNDSLLGPDAGPLTGLETLGELERDGEGDLLGSLLLPEEPEASLEDCCATCEPLLVSSEL
jgi:hypothetical protein